MASKKKSATGPVLFCSVFRYLEARDPPLAEAIESLCMQGSLAPRPDVTFLYPKDEKFRDEIIAAAYSKDAPKAVTMIESLCIPELLTSPADWQSKTVGGLHRVKYNVLSAAAGTVTLAGEGKEPVKLERAADFEALEKPGRPSRSAVWTILSGRPPLAGEKYERTRAKRVTGGGGAAPSVTGGTHLSSPRAQFAVAAELAFDAAMRKDRARFYNPFLAKVCGLLAFLKTKQPALFAAVQPLLDWSPAVSFYLLVEPYKKPSSGPFLIPTEVISGPGGWNGSEGFGDCVSAYKGFMADCGEAKGRDPAAIAKRVDAVRQQLLSAPNKIRTPKQLLDAYAALANANTIDGFGPVLPAETLRALGGGAAAAAKKLWQDETRFILHCSLQSVCAEPIYDSREFRKIAEVMREARPGNDYVRELNLTSSLAGDVSPNANFGFLVKFVSCTDFLYVACPESYVGGAMGSATDPTDLTVFNRNSDALQALGRINGGGRPGLSDETLAELQAYVAQFGSLPPLK